MYVCVYVNIYIYIRIYVYMCSRIELKMTETEQSNCIDQSAPFAMQLALRLCFCQMPIASITNGFTETLNCSGGVTRQKPPNPPERAARASKKRKIEGCRWENTTVHHKVSRNHLAPEGP